MSLLDAPVVGAYHLVNGLASSLEPFAGSSAVACAIVLCTLVVRLSLSPLSLAAVRGERARAALAPRIRELHHRFGEDRERLRHELAELHRDAGTSPVAGCLPALVQLPVLWVLYRLFTVSTVAGQANALLGGSLFGLGLGVHWPVLAGSPVLLVMFVVAAAVACGSSRLQARRMDPSVRGVPRVIGRMAPFGTLVSLAVLPPAAGLSLVVSAAWTLFERGVVARSGA